ncbi:hypothetical protein [Haloferula sp. A504]|uniref:hypothetical protein n=1 Tax=Haloferula sp. A504 TaxID=3373601 RepID=UPI0031C0630B|nr:hypothetical protein [Verrucomicrobiaceae bacterium E54]
MENATTREVCTTLKDRLRTAEAKVRSALEATGADHPLAGPASELLEIHSEIRDLLLDNFETNRTAQRLEDQPEVAMAAVEIEREAHTLKPDFMDVLKALFMWKDDPVERAQNGSQ